MGFRKRFWIRLDRLQAQLAEFDDCHRRQGGGTPRLTLEPGRENRLMPKVDSKKFFEEQSTHSRVKAEAVSNM